MRLLWLPLHLWGEEFFTRLGDACGGFIAVDAETRQRQLLQWARILVKSNREKVPRKLHVMVGVDVFEIQLWWEFTSWLSIVVSKDRCKIPEVGDDGEGISRTGGRVGREEESHVEGGL